MDEKKIISEVVGDLLGEEGLTVAMYLRGKSDVSEFKVAKDLGMDIHTARRTLYRLFEHNLATFERRKDRLKGWYVTYWDFYPNNINHIYRKLQMDKIDKLKERLDRESSSEFYMCRNACTRMDFEKALSFDFKCPECGQLMNPMDNKRTIDFINEKIHELEENLAKN